jgi:hypothetical protein
VQFFIQRSGPAFAIEHGDAARSLAHHQLRLIQLGRNADAEDVDQKSGGVSIRRCFLQDREQGVITDRRGGASAQTQRKGGYSNLPWKPE